MTALDQPFAHTPLRLAIALAATLTTMTTNVDKQ